jgi:beta-galactosidase
MPDVGLPGAIRVRHGQNAQGRATHDYFNFSGEAARAPYPYGRGSDLGTGGAVAKGASIALPGWGVAIVAEN